MSNLPDAGVEDATEPDDQPYDAGSVHGRRLAAALSVSDGSAVLGSKHLHSIFSVETGPWNTNTLYLGGEV